MKKTELDYLLKIRLPVTLFTIVLSFAVTYFVAKPERDGLGYSPEQPIKFSHKLHAGNMNIDCQYCHTSVDKGRFASVPSADICMNCHSVARRDKDEIKKLVEYYEKNQPIPWKRVHKLGDFAYFNHSAHINKGIDCKNCHGDVARMEIISQVNSFTMGACLDCHRQAHSRLPELKDKIKKGPDNCNACHR